MDPDGAASGFRVRFYRRDDGRMFIMHPPSVKRGECGASVHRVASQRERFVCNVLTCKGYYATAEFDGDSKLLCGSVVGMRDGIYFEAESAADVERAFHETVDDYLAFCVKKGRSPEESALTHSAFA